MSKFMDHLRGLWERNSLNAASWLGIALVLAVCQSARGGIEIRTYHVRATASGFADGVDDPQVFEPDIQDFFRSGDSGVALAGKAISANALVSSGAMIAGGGAAGTIHKFNPAADQFTIIMQGSAFGTPLLSNSQGVANGTGEALTKIEFRLTESYHVAFSATTSVGHPIAQARFSFFDSLNPSVNGFLTSGQSATINPGRPFSGNSFSMLYTLEGFLSTGSSVIDDFVIFLSFSAVDVGPIGSGQAAPLPPTVMEEGEYEFVGATSGAWVDPPLTDGYRYTMTGGSLFTHILDFPTGFDDSFRVYVGDDLLGTFGPGQSVDFTTFPGGGVSEFLVRGINPLVDVEDPAGFPLRLAYNTPTANFVMTADPTPTSTGAVPEPASVATWGVMVMAVSATGVSRRRKLRSRQRDESQLLCGR
jgi:hypothetical protein